MRPMDDQVWMALLTGGIGFLVATRAIASHDVYGFKQGIRNAGRRTWAEHP